MCFGNAYKLRPKAQGYFKCLFVGAILLTALHVGYTVLRLVQYEEMTFGDASSVEAFFDFVLEEWSGRVITRVSLSMDGC